MAIIRTNYKANRTRNRTRKINSKTGKRCPGRVRSDGVVTRYAVRAVWYCTYGRAAALDPQLDLPAQQRGVWYGPDGQVCAYAEVHQWAKEHAQAHKYVYSIILSTGPERKVPMRSSDWTKIMRDNGHFPEWRLIAHDDTNHTHAHVIAWSDKVLGRGEHACWHDALQLQLATIERERVRELDLARDHERVPEQAHDLSQEASGMRTRARTQEHGQDLSL